MSMLAATILLAQLHCAPNARRQRGLLRRAEGRRAGPQGRAEPLRRLRPTPERRQARAVREEAERGDGVPRRAGRVPVTGWQTNYSRMLMATCTQ